MTLEESLFAACAAEALFQQNSVEYGIQAEELALIAGYVFVAADEFNKIKDMNDAERQKSITTCAARLTASL